MTREDSQVEHFDVGGEIEQDVRVALGLRGKRRLLLVRGRG